MKQFFKVLIWIVILCGVGFGVYTVLPEHPHAFVQGFFQTKFDAAAKSRISQIKNISIKELDDATYGDVLEKSTGMTCWTYEKDEVTYQEKVTFRGNGASINLKDNEDYNGKLYTSCSVKFEFVITGKNVDIYPYIDDQLMYISDGQHVEKNNEIRNLILSQLYSGMTTNND